MDASNGMTFADYSVLEKVGNRYRGVATTGLTLGAVALGVGVIGIWGANKISEARSRAAEQADAAQALRTNDLVSLVASERMSRETWQRANQPTIGQYVDVQTNPNLSAQLMDYIRTEANASATAAANNSGINSAVGSDPYVRVQLYGAPTPCQCPGNCNGY